ncbi:hypothetical protein [Flexivirga lutea]
MNNRDQTCGDHEVVIDLLHRLGAATVTQPDGVVDFELADVQGLAYLKSKDVLRASYFIVHDPIAEEARRWVQQNAEVPVGELQFWEDGEMSGIRLLVEERVDAVDRIWMSATSAQALSAAWNGRRRGCTGMSETLRQAGILMPPLGAVTADSIATYGRWSWGNAFIDPFALYSFDVDLVIRSLRHRRVMVMSHSGHGANSYGLSTVTTCGPVGAFIQHGYGGAYMDPVEQLIDINSTYSRLHVLFSAAKEQSASELRWLLVYSGFRGFHALVDLEEYRRDTSSGDPTQSFETESDLFSAVANRLSTTELFAGAGGISW